MQSAYQVLIMSSRLITALRYNRKQLSVSQSDCQSEVTIKCVRTLSSSSRQQFLVSLSPLICRRGSDCDFILKLHLFGDKRSF